MSRTRFTVEKDWTTAAGLRAVVTMGTLGFRCGYVGVPVGHVMHGLDYDAVSLADDEWIDVHGGLTFAAGDGKYPVQSDLWWFGFDCGHLGDARSPEAMEEQRRLYPTSPIMWTEDGIHRTVDYCSDECESLAKQIAARGAA